MQLKIVERGPMREYVSFDEWKNECSAWAREIYKHLLPIAAQLKNDVERERLMKEQKRQESAQLAQQLRHLEEKNR